MAKKLYEKIRDDILDNIKNNKFKLNEMIPKETELSLYYGVSRPTVRQAIQLLVNEGYLDRVIGKGTFVKNNKITQDFTQIIKSYNDEMETKGLIPKTNVISLTVTNCPEKVSNALHLQADSKVIKLTRLRFANDYPVVYLNTYLPYDGLEFLVDMDFSKESLYSVLESNDFKINKVTRTLNIQLSDDFSSTILNMNKNEPLFYFVSTGYHDSTPLEYSEAWYNGYVNSFRVELSIN